MTASDIIFWYTGAAVWGCIALLIAIALIVAVCVGCGMAAKYSCQWALMIKLGRGDLAAIRQAIRDAGREYDGPSAEWLNALQKSFEKNRKAK